MKVKQLDVTTDTKTKDNVTVTVVAAVQYCVDPEHPQQALFRLTSQREQMQAYVDDIVRSELPLLDLDEAYEAKCTLSNNIEKELTAGMRDFGLVINRALITDIRPDPAVLAAMNEINA